jgi:nucleoid-associated protein YgaU
MAENTQQRQGYTQPAQVRFLWGKAWNVPAVVQSVAERFERFTLQGRAQRSWLRLRMLRVNETVPQPRARTSFLLSDVPSQDEIGSPEETWGAHEQTQGERLDQLATRTYGDPSLWRLIAAANNVDDPSDVGVGRLLRLPPKPRGRKR